MELRAEAQVAAAAPGRAEMWRPARAGPAVREKRLRRAEKCIWKEEVPKTQNSENCGLERKYASQVWKTKGRKEKRERRRERTRCLNVEPISRCGIGRHPARPPPSLSGHPDGAPLWAAAAAVLCPPPPCVSVHSSLLVSVLCSLGAFVCSGSEPCL